MSGDLPGAGHIRRTGGTGAPGAQGGTWAPTHGKSP